MSENLPINSEALEVVRKIGNEYQRVLALGKLAPQLPSFLLPLALEIARTIEDEEYRAWALGDLAPQLPEALLPSALEAARSIGDEYQRAAILAMLAPQLPETVKGTYKLVSYKNEEETINVDGASCTVTFSAWTVDVNLPVNSGYGMFTQTENKVKITQLAVTDMGLIACGKGTKKERYARARLWEDLEQLFSSLLGSVEGIVDEKMKTITFAGRFRARKPGIDVEIKEHGELVLQKNEDVAE